jgi:gluconolactonase
VLDDSTPDFTSFAGFSSSARRNDVKTNVHDPLRFEVLASDLGFPEGPVVRDDGSVLLVDIDRARIVRIARGEQDIVATTGGGPNGLAIGPDGLAYVANNGGFLWTESDGFRIPIDRATHTNEPPGFEGGWIERVDLTTGRVERLHDACDGRRLRGPNDLVFDEVGGLWFTDHGKGRHASVDRGGLYYLPPGGGAVRAIAFPLLGPNGVGLSPDGRRVYVAETPTGRLWAWDLAEPGVVRPSPGSLAVRHGGVCVAATRFSFDSLAVEEDGRIVIGAIGDGLVVVTPDGGEVDVHPIPGDVTTNLAFGGRDLRRAVITLSRSGRLVETTWPRPGLRLNA